MAGPLAVSLTADISKYQAAMTRARDIAVRHASDISSNFVGAAANINAAFKGIEGLGKLPGQMNLAKNAAIGLAGTGALILASYAAASSAISQANDQLDRFVQLGQNAEKAGVGVEFFQRFSEAAEKAKLDVAEIEAALKRAGSVVTPKFEQPDAIKGRLNELFETGYLGTFQSKGLADYNGARNNEERIRAAVEAMRELNSLGERLAAIDLADRLFGPETADRIRSGRLEIEAIATALDRQREDLIKQEEVDRAIEYREQLDAAYKSIDEALHVSVSLASVGRDILDVWLGIAKATATAASGAGTLLERMVAAARLGDTQSPLAPRARQPGEGSLGADLGFDAAVSGRGKTLYDAPIGPERPAGIQDPPMPPRRPLSFFTEKEAPARTAKAKAPATETLDQVETYINGVERSTEALKAEVDAIGKSAAERQSAINVARLEAIARQQGITLTAEQIAKVRDLSTATAEYKEKLEEARESQEALRSIGGEVLRGIANDARNGASAMDVLINAVGRLSDRLSDRVMDSFADALFGKSGGTQGGLLSGLFGGSGGGVGLESLLGFATGSVSPIPRFANGGHVTGPGTGTSDSIPALLSNREFVVNARATAQHRGLLEAINSGRVARFATGGLVGAEALGTAGKAGGGTGEQGAGSVVSIAPVIHLTAAGGSETQNADLAERVGKQIEGSMRALIVREMRQQMRPMGLLAR